jgi:hypothetical protein
MSTGEILGIVSVGLTAVLLIVVWLRTRPQNVSEAISSLQEVSAVAQTAVAAAEQLWTTGKLPRDERFTYALDLLETEFPALKREHLIAALEAAVFWLKTGLAARQPST